MVSVENTRIQRDVEATNRNITFHLSVVLDGVVEIRETPEPPAVKHWDKVESYKGGDTLVIEAEQVTDILNR